MKKTIGILIFLTSALLVSAQDDFAPGYLVDNQSDTLFGKIYSKTKPGKGRVVFRNQEGKKKTYYPRQIKGFVIRDTMVYQSILQIENAEAAAYHVFGLRIITGRLNLLATHNKISAIFMTEDQQDVNNYYIEDSESGKLYKLTKTGFRKQLAAMISDYTELRREVMNKVYKYEEIPEVVEKYNKWIERNAE